MLMVLIGPSGAGKTTFAKSYIQANPNWVRVSRDDLRLQITGNDQFGAYFQENNRQLEKHVTHLQMEQIRYWLKHGYHVIVDNPHLKTKYLHVYKEQFGYLTDILFVPIRNADNEVCKKRIRQREGEHVNVDYIDRHFSHFRLVLQEADHLLDRTILQKNQHRESFVSINKDATSECILVDLDGIMSGYGESFLPGYNWPALTFILSRLKGTGKRKVTVVYLSDREEIFRSDVIQWIKDNHLPWDDQLLMRPVGDSRSEIAIKLQHFMQEVALKYRPLFVIEENVLLVRAIWQKLGVFCLNVALPAQIAA